ncbi:MAG: VCBS repeat-containing protein, partial [Myxococcales bacterium]|nr:VCBS repeat-containing protein [Myxococcales bacterium]
ALGDLDGDGALDAVHNSIGSEVWVYRGLGDGRFERRQVLPRGVNPATGPLDDTRDIHLLDMTGDGWLDLVYAASPNFLRFPAAVVPGRGDGTFPDPRFPGADTAITGSAQIHDVNGDGRLDLVHFSRGGRILSFQLGEGGRALDRRQVLDCADPDTCHASTRAALADVTGDGRPDLLFPARDRLVVRRQRPDGTFEADRSLALENLRPQPPQLGPWAADGGLAVVVTQAYVPAEPANRQGVVSRVPLGAGGQPGTPQVILDDDSRRLGALVVPRAGGEAWLVEVLRSPAQLRVARYTPATNTVHAASTVDLPGDPGVLLNHARGDLDGDGAADLVLLTRGGAVVLRQTAAGFERVGDPLGPCFDAADVGDLDGDGRADLVLGAFVVGQPGQLCQEANPDGGGLTVMWGDGALGFEAQPIGGLGFHVTVADMNGDGLD